MTKRKNLVAASGLCLFLISCSGSDKAPVAGTSISGLPNNTDPVSTSTSSSFASKAIASFKAITGLKINQWSDTDNWQAGNSRALCEVGQVLKDSLSEAMNPDKIKCYVGSVAENSGLELPSDGSDIFMKLTNFGESPDLEPRIKMKITKDSTGQIKSFEMWSCFDFDGTNYVQSEYLLQEIGTDLSITSYSKYTGSEGAETYGSVSNVTGTLDSSFKWLSKNMALQNYYNGNSGSYSQDLNIVQRASSFVVSGYNNGSWGQDIFSNSMYSAIQGLNMSSPKEIALGDGSAKFDFDWCFDSDSDGDCADEVGNNRHTDTDTTSWNGDTRANLATAADGDFHTEVSAATVPTVGTVAAISFTGAEAWDCSASSSFQEANLADMQDPTTVLGAAFQSCDTKYDYRDETDGGYACDAAQ